MVYSTHDYSKDFDATTPFYLPQHELNTVFLIGGMYLAGIFICNRAFGSLKLQISFIMFIYNICLSLLSLWMFLGFFTPFVENWKNENFSFRLLYDDPELKLSQNMQWFYLLFYWSKYVEYLDTFWTILLGKLKFNPRCVLQVYHHFVTPLIVYCGLYYPWTANWAGPLTNTFVHVIMYAYYAGSYLFKQKWYKGLGSYIFYVQMTQFITNILLSTLVNFYGYISHKNAQMFVYVQYLIFVGLFIAFYLFRKKEMKSKKL